MVAPTPTSVAMFRRLASDRFCTAKAAIWLMTDTPASRKTYRQSHQA